jgi:hypothetical protein
MIRPALYCPAYKAGHLTIAQLTKQDTSLKDKFRAGHLINAKIQSSTSLYCIDAEQDTILQIHSRILHSCTHRFTAQIKHTAKTQYRKFEINIPRKGTARLQSAFLDSCFCERFIYSSDRSAYSAAGK